LHLFFPLPAIIIYVVGLVKLYFAGHGTTMDFAEHKKKSKEMKRKTAEMNRAVNL
jgi:hypothetical protein